MDEDPDADASAFLDELASEFSLPRSQLDPSAVLWVELGLDSLDVARLLAWTEDRCGRVTEGDLPELVTIGDLLEHRLALLARAGGSQL